MSDAGVDQVELDGELEDDEADEVDAGNRVVGSVSRDVLEYLAKAIVDEADSVVVEVTRAAAR